MGNAESLHNHGRVFRSGDSSCPAHRISRLPPSFAQESQAGSRFVHRNSPGHSSFSGDLAAVLPDKTRSQLKRLAELLEDCDIVLVVDNSPAMKKYEEVGLTFSFLANQLTCPQSMRKLVADLVTLSTLYDNDGLDLCVLSSWSGCPEKPRPAWTPRADTVWAVEGIRRHVWLPPFMRTRGLDLTMYQELEGTLATLRKMPLTAHLEIKDVLPSLVSSLSKRITTATPDTTVKKLNFIIITPEFGKPLSSN